MCSKLPKDLLQDASVQAVYVPVPTTLKAELVLQVLASKKHVLVEKPLLSRP